MTNYEKLREVFSRTIFVLQKNAFHETTAIMVSDEWLNSEYEEPADRICSIKIKEKPLFMVKADGSIKSVEPEIKRGR